MERIIQFVVNDTSPTIVYQPPSTSTDSSENGSTGWVPCFTDIGCAPFFPKGRVPRGNSNHSTSQDNASLTVSWRGTGVQLMGSATNYSCVNYSINLDGDVTYPPPDNSQQVLASFHDLNLQDHTITLIVHNPDSKLYDNIVFREAKITVNDTTSGVVTPFNDTNIIYDGSWTSNTSSFGQFQRSTTAGDVAKTYFQGTSILVYGKTSPLSGEYSVSLTPSNENNQTHARYAPSTFSAKTPFTNPDALLFYAFDLDPTVNYSLGITNEGGGDLFVRTDGFQVYEQGGPTAVPSVPSTTATPASVPTSRISGGSIAAIALAGLLFFLIAALLFFYILVYRPRVRRCHAQADALMADGAKLSRHGDPIMRLEEASKSQTSSYRKRLARIISMINAPEPKRPSWRSEPQQFSPISPVSTHKSDFILDICRAEDIKDGNYVDQVSASGQPPTEEGTVLVHVPTETLESEPQRSQDPGSEGDSRRGGTSEHHLLHPRHRSSPNATVPVSPSISSTGNTESRNNGSRASFRSRSNRFSLPFSLSIPYVRSRSDTEDSTGSGGNFRGRYSRAVGLDYQGHVDSDAGDEDGDKSMSSIVFAETNDKSPTSGAPRARTDAGKAKVKPVKALGIREELGRSLRSFIWSLGGPGRRRQSGRGVQGENIIYPFVGISSTTRPGRLVSGGGLIVLEYSRGDPDGSPGVLEIPRPDATREQTTPPQGQSPHSPGTEPETDITPLSYGTQSEVSAPTNNAADVGAATGEVQRSDTDADESPTTFPSTYPFSTHPYAAVARPSDSEERIPVERTLEDRRAAASAAVSQPPRRQTAPPASGYRILPAIPKALPAIPKVPPVVIPAPPSQARTQTTIRPSSDNITGVPTGGRAIRALPPLPLASGSTTAAQAAPASSEPSQGASVARKLLSPHSAVEEEKADGDASPSSSQGVNSPGNPERTQEDSESIPSPSFLSVRRISPFKVNLPYVDDEQAPDEKLSNTKGKDGLPGKQKRPVAHPKPPRLRIASAGATLQPPVLTPRTSKSTAQLSFLDFSTSSSSSNRDSSTRGKSETSSESGHPAQQLDERLAEENDDRRTFGQRGGRSSFYYNSGDTPLPSPSSSQWTHQTHQTHQTYQSQSQEAQRPSSWSQHRRRHASWRTFGSRIERDIPEEALPLESADTHAPLEAQAPLETLMEVSPVEQLSSNTQDQPPSPPLVNTTSDDADEPTRAAREGRTSYMSTSSGGHAHVHPLGVSFSLHQPHPYSFQPPPLRLSQIEPVSPLTEEMSASPMQFRTGGVRRTSSGDVQPVTHRRHNRNGGSSSSGSGSEYRPPPSQHPFSIP